VIRPVSRRGHRGMQIRLATHDDLGALMPLVEAAIDEKNPF